MLPKSKRRNWKQLLMQEAPLLLPAAHDALTAKLIERVGFKAYQIGGFALAGRRSSSAFKAVSTRASKGMKASSAGCWGRRDDLAHSVFVGFRPIGHNMVDGYLCRNRRF